jgi:hypothetical protein
MPPKRPTGSSLEVNISRPEKFSLGDDSEENDTCELKQEVGTQTDGGSSGRTVPLLQHNCPIKINIETLTI